MARNMTTVRAHHTAGFFLEASRALLEEKEAENNLILGLAETLERDINYYGDLPPLLLTVHDQSAACIGAGLQTPPKNLILYAAQPNLERPVRGLCRYLADHEISIPGIIGPRDTVLAFGQIWTSLFPVSSRILMSQGVYRLDRLNPVSLSPGRLRQATGTDIGWVAEWIQRFTAEVLLPVTAEEAASLAEKKIGEGAFYLWETDRPVCMAAWTRPTRNGVTVAYVYTPPDCRNQGFASSCVAGLSERLLSKYRFCSLYTDLGNPTSNSIYQKIGYQLIDHVLQCGFFED